VTEETARLSLYRRWRPQRFADIVGQEETVRTLRNAVISGEVAHAYLFAGERGIGKTSIARILARAVNCLAVDGGEPCNRCVNCTAILANRSLDIAEIDGASNRGIDHIRRLREEVNFSPANLRRKVYIIDEVHMLTNEAFNALLKTLEEPPPHAMFAFATTEPHKVPRTIVSRCQAFTFRRIPSEQIAHHLRAVADAEGVRVEDDAADLIGRRANGGMRDALVMLEQAMSYGSNSVSADIVLDMLGLVGRETHEAFVDAIEGNNRRAVLETIDSLAERGKDLDVFLGDIVELLRDRLVTQENPSDREVTISRRLLDIKAELFRSLDRRVRLEIGLLHLMADLHPSTPDPTPALRTGRSAKPTPSPSDATSVRPAQPGTPGEPTAATPARAGSRPAERELQPDGAAQSSADPEFEARWSSLFQIIEQERIAIAAFLTEGRVSLDGNRLRIAFHPEHTFHKESLEKRGNSQYLAGVVRRHLGDDVRVEIAYDESVERKPLPQEILREKVRLVCEMFDGKVVKEE